MYSQSVSLSVNVTSKTNYASIIQKCYCHFTNTSSPNKIKGSWKAAVDSYTDSSQIVKVVKYKLRSSSNVKIRACISQFAQSL